MDHDYKRLKGILLSYKDKKGDEMKSQEYKSRENVAELLRECNALFQLSFKDQTSRFENNSFKSGEPQQSNVDLDEYLIKVTRKLEMLEKQNIMSADSELQFDSNFGLLQYVYLPSAQESNPIAAFAGGSGGSGEADTGMSVGKPYEAKVRLQHSYFLATMLNMRSLGHFVFDITCLMLSITLFFGAMNILVSKGQIANFHDSWKIDL